MSSYKPWASFEREIVRKFKDMGFDATRNWQSQFVSKDGVDVKATDGYHELILQLKYGKQPNLKQALKEAKSAITNKKQIPMGIVRFKGEKNTVVVLSWEGLERLLDNG